MSLSSPDPDQLSCPWWQAQSWARWREGARGVGQAGPGGGWGRRVRWGSGGGSWPGPDALPLLGGRSHGQGEATSGAEHLQGCDWRLLPGLVPTPMVCPLPEVQAWRHSTLGRPVPGLARPFLLVRAGTINPGEKQCCSLGFLGMWGRRVCSIPGGPGQQAGAWARGAARGWSFLRGWGQGRSGRGQGRYALGHVVLLRNWWQGGGTGTGSSGEGCPAPHASEHGRLQCEATVAEARVRIPGGGGWSELDSWVF